MSVWIIGDQLAPESQAWSQKASERPGSRVSMNFGSSRQSGRNRRGDFRSPCRKDRDRILYSGAFSRLAGVTQVITPSATGLQTHNRLTHSLKVAQVARSIAESLQERKALARRLDAFGGVDADAAEAAALAHDLGHPPFGHAGEQALDRQAKGLGLASGFEGNAQSFRIVTVLERHADGCGLNLTVRTLAGLLKYPWPRRIAEDDGFPRGGDSADLTLNYLRSGKFCSYETDEAGSKDESWDAFLECLKVIPRDRHGRPRKSVEAAIMDLADDITYATHDLEDFYRLDLINRSLIERVGEDWSAHSDGDAATSTGYAAFLGGLAKRLSRSFPNHYHPAIFESAVDEVLDLLFVALDNKYSDGRSQDADLRAMISDVISGCLDRIKVSKGDELAPPVQLASLDWHRIEVIKSLTKHFVIQSPKLAGVQIGQERVLEELVGMMYRWLLDEPKRVPPLLRGYVNDARAAGVNHEQAQARAVIDYVAGLTDLQALEVHRMLKGGITDLANPVVNW